MSTLVERLEAEAVKEMDCGFDTVHSLLLREAAAALRATGKCCPNAGTFACQCNTFAPGLRATGEGEWPDDATVERALLAWSDFPGTGPETIEPAMRAALKAAAPTPAEPKAGISEKWCVNMARLEAEAGVDVEAGIPAEPTNPGEISSKVVGPLRDAGTVALTVAMQALEEAEDMLSDARMKLSAFKPTAHPAPQQPAITDAMVDAVGSGLYIYWNDVSKSCREKYREKVRRVLTAAQEGKP